MTQLVSQFIHGVYFTVEPRCLMMCIIITCIIIVVIVMTTIEMVILLIIICPTATATATGLYGPCDTLIQYQVTRLHDKVGPHEIQCLLMTHTTTTTRVVTTTHDVYIYIMYAYVMMTIGKLCTVCVF